MPQRSDSSTLPMPLNGTSSNADPVPGIGADAMASPLAPSMSPLSVPLRTLTLLFLSGSVVVAGLLGFVLAAWIEPVSPWMVALAAAVGVMLTALPLALALLGLVRRGEPAAAQRMATAAAAGPATNVHSAGLAHEASGRPGAPAAHGVSMNRELFMDMVGREWSRARRYGTGAALLLMEIDRYPRLTDALGDAAGEKVLADLLRATAPTLRGADALARFEAGQIAVFLAHADATGALDVAERIRERAEQMEVAVPPRRVRFTVSLGVAHLRPAHLHLQALVDDVSDALTAARTVGGNCVRAAPVDPGPRAAPGAARDGSRADKG
jgi:diguanylate cyclase (GGDEF)-like protein